MAWALIVLAGLLEIVWAIALGLSEGFSKLGPSLVFVVAMAASMLTLGFAMTDIPVGVGYAVFVGIGATGTAILGAALLGESFSAVKVVCLVAIIGGIVGMKVVT
jgi:quaternary ammonium compound-resistance protein SugE